MKRFLYFIPILSLTIPFFAQALTKLETPAPVAVVELGKISNVNSLVARIAGIGDVVVYLLVALAVIFIVYNVVWYMIRPDGSDSRREAGTSILWGLIGLFVIVSIWGIVNILTNTFSTDSNVPSDRFPNANFVTDQQKPTFYGM